MESNHLRKIHNYGFVLVEDFSLLPMTSAIEAMRMANQLLGFTAYSWSIITQNGESIKASDGLRIHADLDFSADFSQFNTIFVCAGINVDKRSNSVLLRFLRQLEQETELVIGSLCTGSYLLAQAGLLQNTRCTISWDHMEMLCETFPSLNVESSIFIEENQRLTCAGGTAPLDLIMNIVYKDFSRDISNQISEVFLTERMRGEGEKQKIPLKASLGNSHEALIDAIGIMEENTEELVDLNSIAEYVNISRRQLERLFKKNLQDSPSRYYLKIRLNKARRLLMQTNMSITDISISCGFSSTTLFSNSYRGFFGFPPGVDRRNNKNNKIEGFNSMWS
ncbi:GlxA family transcriptional regulator [Marinomonas sp. 5E14-1]|uniref:GlxA family transcriptional regulator n=1 Tax=Marinomonas sp. 5E14-1 TaxID=3153922 RepID=UPI0032656024